MQLKLAYSDVMACTRGRAPRGRTSTAAPAERLEDGAAVEQRVHAPRAQLDRGVVVLQCRLQLALARARVAAVAPGAAHDVWPPRRLHCAVLLDDLRPAHHGRAVSVAVRLRRMHALTRERMCHGPGGR